jgi:hypothetical protein
MRLRAGFNLGIDFKALEVVRQRGGTPSQTVTKRTNLLIVGELGWPLLDDGRPSNKRVRRQSMATVLTRRDLAKTTGSAALGSLVITTR